MLQASVYDELIWVATGTYAQDTEIYDMLNMSGAGSAYVLAFTSSLPMPVPITISFTSGGAATNFGILDFFCKAFPNVWLTSDGHNLYLGDDDGGIIADTRWFASLGY